MFEVDVPAHCSTFFFDLYVLFCRTHPLGRNNNRVAHSFGNI